MRCTLCFDGNRLDVTIPAIGTYMVSNALAAVAAGKLLGLSDEELKRGVESYKTVGSRAHVINTGSLRVIDDCYNANPTSVKASLDTLKNFDGRTVAILRSWASTALSASDRLPRSLRTVPRTFGLKASKRSHRS